MWNVNNTTGYLNWGLQVAIREVQWWLLKLSYVAYLLVEWPLRGLPNDPFVDSSAFMDSLLNEWFVNWGSFMEWPFVDSGHFHGLTSWNGCFVDSSAFMDCLTGFGMPLWIWVLMIWLGICAFDWMLVHWLRTQALIGHSCYDKANFSPKVRFMIWKLCHNVLETY